MDEEVIHDKDPRERDGLKTRVELSKSYSRSAVMADEKNRLSVIEPFTQKRTCGGHIACLSLEPPVLVKERSEFLQIGQNGLADGS